MPSGFNDQWGLVHSFYIDTEGYTERDREMFVAGAEYMMLTGILDAGWRGNRPVHRENASRLRMLCGKLGIPCRLDPHEGYEGCETWSEFITGDDAHAH